MTQRSPRIRARMKARRRKEHCVHLFRSFLKSAVWKAQRKATQATSPTAPGSAVYVIHSGTFTQSTEERKA